MKTGLIVLAAACALLSGTAIAHADTRPNIVVIVSDDQDDQSPLYLEPTVKRLAGQGTRFVNSFVSFSECGPSRASFLTGQAAHNNNVLGNNPPHGGYANYRPSEDNTLNVWLHNAGYRTALIGKFINGYENAENNTHVPPGWDNWQAFNDPKGIYRYFDYTMNENGVTVKYRSLPTDYSTDVLARKATDFIHSTPADQPLFMVVTPVAPHGAGQSEDIKGTPVPPPRYVGRYDNEPFVTTPNFNEEDVSDKPAEIQALPMRDLADMTRQFRRRREAILGIDDLIQSVVDQLTADGRIANTYIVVTSDNGWSQGSHRHVGKILLYEEANRVPLVIVGPGVPAGQVRYQMVNNLDLSATVMEWAGVTPGRVPDGRSLTPLIASATAPWRSALLLENRNDRGVRTGKEILIRHMDTGEMEFYDLKGDPYELQNHMDDPRVPALTVLLDSLSNCAGATCWVPK